MNEHIGSSLNDFLNEEGLLAETEAVAIKRVIALRLEQAMERHYAATAHSYFISDLGGRLRF
jgi:hypothetical protein